MKDVWKEATFLMPDDPKAIEMQLRHLQGHTERRLAISQEKAEGEQGVEQEKPQEAAEQDVPKG